MRYTNIIWDFNGTLINDLDIAVDSLNDMLRNRDKMLLSRDRYLSIYENDIIRLYEKLFDLENEPFLRLGNEFMTNYLKRAEDAKLMEGANEVLNNLKLKGLKQVIISSFEQEGLNKCIEHLQIGDYFEKVLGQNNIECASKLNIMRDYIVNNNIDVEKTIIIGDLESDYEIACELKCNCILIAQGHQSKEALESSGAIVLDTIYDVVSYIENN